MEPVLWDWIMSIMQFWLDISFMFFVKKRIYTVLFGFLSMYKEPWALLGFGLNLTYNGERGKQNKFLNYCFYPGHLLLLGALRMYLKI